jgi:hypothetical protein
MSGIKRYGVFFYKKTHHTVNYVIKAIRSGRYAFRDLTREKIGTMHMGRCDDDSAKWKVEVTKSLGKTNLYEHGYPKTVDIMLFNECRSSIPEYYYPERHEKNDELVRYYMELKNKKKTKNNI